MGKAPWWCCCGTRLTTSLHLRGEGEKAAQSIIHLFVCYTQTMMVTNFHPPCIVNNESMGKQLKMWKLSELPFEIVVIDDSLPTYCLLAGN